MAIPLIMPKFGMAQREATIIRWLKHEGDMVEAGEPLLEVTTDKVVMEVEAPASGILRGVLYDANATVPVTQVIAYIVPPGEEWVPPAHPTPAAPGADAAATQRQAADVPARATPLARRVAAEHGVDVGRVAASGPGGRVVRSDVEHYVAGLSTGEKPAGKVRATPAARSLARQAGVDLATLVGSGPRHRVQAADVTAAAQREASTEDQPADVVPLAGLRRTIAERMAESARSAPHITLQIDVDMSRAEALRHCFNAAGEARVTLTAIIVKACAWALKRHPYVNASLHDGAIHLWKEVHVGVAVALPEGLIVPVVRDADGKGLRRIAEEIADLTQRARENRLTPDDVAGGTFTVSNLGMFGIDRFTAIINPPQSAILAVGRMARRVIPADETGGIAVRPMVTLTLSADHRVLDGAVAARFLGDLRQAIEEPGWLAY